MLWAAQDGCVACVETYVTKGGCVLNDGRRLTVWDGSRNHPRWNAWKAMLEGSVAGNQGCQEAVRRYLSGLPYAQGRISETEEYWCKKGNPNQDFWPEKWSRKPSDETVPMSGVWVGSLDDDELDANKGGMPSHGETSEPSIGGEKRVPVTVSWTLKKGGMPRGADVRTSMADKETEEWKPGGDDSIQEFHQLCRRGDLESIKSWLGSDPWRARWWLFATSEVHSGQRLRASDHALIGRGTEAFHYLVLMEHTVLMEAARI